MSKQGNVLYYFTLAMSFIYILIGLYIIFAADMITFLENKRFALGPLFILYGIYRIYRLSKLRKQSDGVTR